jgi:hypothetical protein
MTQRGPYSLMVHWNDGRVTEQANGHSPTIVREAEQQVTRNPRVISRIVLVDLTGPLDTIWSKDWA